MSETTETKKYRTITMTDRPPVRIVEADWPEIASDRNWEGQYDFQSFHIWSLRVREHSDGRRIVYGVCDGVSSCNSAGGVMTDKDGTILAIHRVSEIIGHPAMAAHVIADLPAEEIE